MKKMRNRADLFKELSDYCGILVQSFGCVGTELVGFTLDHSNVHGHSGEQLTCAVVQVPSEAPALLILHLLKTG